MMSDCDSDDDLGPKPISVGHEVRQDEDVDVPVKKRARIQRQASKYEPVYLEQLPSADYYEHSYMHRDLVTHIVVSKKSEFLITGSADGHVKFWKKMPTAIEFVKHYQAHLEAIHDMVLSTDEKLLVTTSADKMMKLFEILGFDMSNMIELPYVPKAAVWLTGPRNVSDRVAISDMHSGKIRVYKVDSTGEVLLELSIHSSPVV
jgi:peptidylprolyl isomerase domain and WD repeat-containing protein 1